MKWWGVVSVLSILLIGWKTLTTTAWATQNELLPETQLRQLLYFMERDRKNPLLLHFDRSRALANRAPAEVLHIGENLERLSTQYSQGQTLSIAVYGNWCGPGYGEGEPIDRLDAHCKRHDECYAKRGYFSCSCDEEFIAGVRRDYSEMKPGEQQMALLMIAYFSAAPCRTDQSVA